MTLQYNHFLLFVEIMAADSDMLARTLVVSAGLAHDPHHTACMEIVKRPEPIIQKVEDGNCCSAVAECSSVRGREQITAHRHAITCT